MLFLANCFFLSFFVFLFPWPCSFMVWRAYNVTCVQPNYISRVFPNLVLPGNMTQYLEWWERARRAGTCLWGLAGT